jgi:hypothetical protein
MKARKVRMKRPAENDMDMAGPSSPVEEPTRKIPKATEDQDSGWYSGFGSSGV